MPAAKRSAIGWYEDYKAHRPPPPDDLIPQFNLVRQATEAFGVPAVELEDWEADDLIAAYAKAVNDAGGQANLVSSDKDLMQLIRPGVEMLDPIKQKPIGPAEVMEKDGVTPDKMIDVQALIGDPTDNVPGVPGIGPKGAAQLVNEFGDLAERRAGRGAGDEAVQAPRQPDRTCREGAHLARPGDVAQRYAVAAADRSTARARLRQAALARWLKTQGFRSIATRLGLDSEAPAPATKAVEAAPRLAQGTLALPEAERPAIAEATSASGGTRRSRARLHCALSWPKARPAASSPSTPRPTDW